MINNFLKTAWRNILKHPLFSFINIVGLSLGLLCSLLILLWVVDEWRTNRFHQEIDQIYYVYANDTQQDLKIWRNTPANLADALKEAFPEIQYAAKVLWPQQHWMQFDEDIYHANCRYVNPDFFQVFSFPLVQGDPAKVISQPNSMVLTEKMAEKFTDKGNPVGKSLQLDKSLQYAVSGLMRDPPPTSSLQFDAILPLADFEVRNPWMKNWDNFNATTYIKVHPETDMKNLAERIKGFLAEQSEQTQQFELGLQAYKDTYLYAEFKQGKPVSGSIQEVRMFAAIAFFILLVACINFINLSTARASKRAKEVGVRKTLGASKHTLTAQFLFEALFTACLAGILALALAHPLLPSFNALTAKQLTLEYHQPLLWLGLISMIILTALLAGLYPALFLSRLQPVKTLKGLLSFSTSSLVMRKGLVIFQFSLSSLLILATLIVFQQMHHIRTKNLGFEKENLLAIPLGNDMMQSIDALKNEILHSPGIKSVSISSHLPNQAGATSSDLQYPGKAADEKLQVHVLMVGNDFMETTGIELLEGRDFGGEKDYGNIIINESAADAMGLAQDALEKEIGFWQGKGRIIGVVKDFHFQSMHSPIRPLIFTYMPANAGYLLAKIDGSRTAEAVKHISSTYETFSGGLPVNYLFLDEAFERQYRAETILGQMINYFAGLSISIALMGMFGLVCLMIEKRRKEIGIRKVLGASLQHLVGIISWGFLKLISLSLLLGFLIGWFLMGEWLENFAYRIELAWWMFGAVGLAMILLGILIVGLHSLRAALQNPAKSLKAE